MMIVLATPAVNRSTVAFPVCIAVSQIGLCLAVNPNQNRASTIARMHTVNGTGALTGMSRVLFSAGETVGPLVCILLLYPLGTGTSTATMPRIGTLLPYMLTAAMHAFVLCSYITLGISPHVDPQVPAPPKREDETNADVGYLASCQHSAVAQ